MTKGKVIAFSSYLELKDLRKGLSLTPNNQLYFHWSDWSKSTEAKGLYLKQNDGNVPGLSSGVRVVLRGESFNEEFSLEEIFDYKISPHTSHKIPMLLKATGPIYVRGPNREEQTFYQLSDVYAAFGEEYKEYVFQLLLDQKLKARDFRVRASFDVVSFSGTNLENFGVIKLHQITKGGLLFSLSGGDFYRALLGKELLRLEFDLMELKELIDVEAEKNLLSALLSKGIVSDLQKFRKRDVYYVNVNEIKRCVGGASGVGAYPCAEDFYFFIGYDALVPDQSSTDIKSFFANFLGILEASLLPLVTEKKAS